jgi:N-acetylmuramoyl-L-alanine amidase
MLITKLHISNDKRPGTKLVPSSITIHSTGNPKSTAQNERAWLLNKDNTRDASFHYVVDDKEIIEVIPPNEIAWHSGSSSGNKTSLSVEICESGDREKTLQNAMELVVYLMNTHNITKVVRHFDWSKKVCPKILSADNWKQWNEFHDSIMEEYARQNEKVDPPQQQFGIVHANVLNVRNKANTVSQVIGQLKRYDKVRIGGKVANFYSIYYGDHGGFVHQDYITADGKIGIVNASILNIRSEPNTSSKIVDKMLRGQKVIVVVENNSFYHIPTIGYVHKNYIKLED